MAAMDDHEKAKYESQSQQLRLELKIWESDWAHTHDGRKPARHDIKQNADIAQKYKQYSKLRDILAGKVPPPPPPPPPADDDDTNQRHHRKRKQADAALPPAHTPSKRSRPATTPLKTQSHPDNLLVVTPSLSRKLFSPATALPTSIGPTPQKDGRVLGLFDLLTKTPSRSTGEARPVLIDTTPTTKRHADATAQTPSTNNRRGGARTPSSSRNRDFLDSFMFTPLHKRDGNSQRKTAAAATGATTPSSSWRSVSKLQFATPAFLRRQTAVPLPPVDENGEWKVEPIKLPRKPLGRGLSSVVAGLRKIEDEALDEELHMLREMEEEENMFAGGASRKSKSTASALASAGQEEQQQSVVEKQSDGVQDDRSLEPAVAVTPSATVLGDEKEKEMIRPDKPVLLGGFDDEALYDSQEEEQLDRGQPLRIFKKKGQKRTTRRVNMRPTRMKRPTAAAAAAAAGDDVSGSEDDDNDDVVPETQFAGNNLPDDDHDPLASDPLLSGSEFGNDDGEYSDNDGGAEEAARRAPKVAKAKAKAEKPKPKPKGNGKEKKGKGEEEEGEEKEGLVKKTVRKVKATAHANFKRLKLRNNGAKGGPGYNSKFRRRR
ncbi:DNA replication/checkpoint protein [Bombardia bombarda]|uniref:DNA replication regulator SLD2 n=1 Tax=Bombardia bombarda TaxID=252184 RepID=A0AA40C5B5_9PEZI|nr:DNA replication/checkpoint protein [Bombardia bombarda]